MKSRTLVTPVQVLDLAEGEGTTYWKHILPEAPIVYNADGRSLNIDFNREYLTDLAESFKAGALDQTPFMLADSDNKHTMDPERYRADVVDMRLAEGDETPGLYAKIKFDSKKDADAVLRNPRLGVSARIREGISRADGKNFKRAIVHVLGTLDPKITGLRGWTPALDLSSEYAADNVLDLSTAAYSEVPVAKTDQTTTSEIVVPDIENVTEEDIAKMDEATLDAFLAKYAGGVTDESEPEGDDDTEAEGDADTQTEDTTTQTPSAPTGEARELQEASLSNADRTDIDLANAVASQALAKANAAEKRAAAAEWAKDRASYEDAGVPPHLLDLATPVLSRLDEMVIDLSNTDDDNVNVTAIVRGLLDAAKGTIDLSVNSGHGGSDAGTADPVEQALLAGLTKITS